MYCPKCGQSQVSGEVHFCTRCGLSLKVVKELIINDGVAPAKCEVEVQGIGPSQRQKGTRFGAKLVFWGLVFVPVTLAFALLVKSPYLFLISLIIVLAGLGRVLYARLFEEVQCSPKQDAQSVLVRDSTLLNSPDVSHTNSNSFSPSPREIIAPQSITEHTTKLLDS
jgi:hypothetical protein